MAYVIRCRMERRDFGRLYRAPRLGYCIHLAGVYGARRFANKTRNKLQLVDDEFTKIGVQQPVPIAMI